MQAHRFSFLDGIRGIAALFVLTRHSTWLWGFSPWHSYLAVDLFFVLSGFVIAFAYDDRLRGGRLSLAGFAAVRLIRLYPVYFLSVLCCLGVEALQAAAQGMPLGAELPGGWPALATSVLLLPAFTAMPGDLFPFNGPAWSLFFEVLANLLYALLRPRLSNRRLAAIVLLAGICCAGGTLHHGSIDLGYAWGSRSVAMGLARALFGVFLGLLLQRRFTRLAQGLPRVSPWLAVAMSTGVLALPDLGALNAWIDLLAIFVLFPLCVLWAAQAPAASVHRGMLALGAASYPLYVLHVPLNNLLAFASRGRLSAYAPLAGVLFAGALVVLAIATEQAADLPLRRWLTRRVFGP